MSETVRALADVLRAIAWPLVFGLTAYFVLACLEAR